LTWQKIFEDFKLAIKDEEARKLLRKILKHFVEIFDPLGADITHCEKCYCGDFLNYILKLIIKFSKSREESQTRFFYDKEKPMCVYEELKKFEPDLDRRNRCNADGVVRLGSYDDLEVMLLEASSKYGLNNKTKHAADHLKGQFALLGMFEKIANTYQRACIA
jgi:hypothetical protein